MNRTSVWAFARLELSEALRSKWVALATTLYLGMVAAFVWLGLRESSMLGFPAVTLRDSIERSAVRVF